MQKPKKISENARFFTDGKTGFFAYNFVLITDVLGTVVYMREGKKPGEKIQFNLPAGEYVARTQFFQDVKPRMIKIKPVRKRERTDLKLPEKVTYYFNENPNKATIELLSGKITLDNSFKNAPEAVKKFVLYHEVGHFFYRTEEFCDEYAAERMLNEGYNPSQIHAAAHAALSQGNERVQKNRIKLKNCCSK